MPANAGAPGVPSGESFPWDWALDFRNVIVEIAASSRVGTRNPRHFQRGAYDGQVFGYSEPSSGTEDVCVCHLLSDPSGATVENVPAEYLRPARPTLPGQVVVVIGGDGTMKGQQRTTEYADQGQWMMRPENGEMVPAVLGEGDLCRIWKT